MVNFFAKIFIVSFTVTLITEFVLAIILGIREKKDLLNVVLVNILTNPMLVALTLYINLYYGLKWRNILIYPLEIVVWLVEGFIYKKYLNYKRINPFVLSLILNVSSYLVGLVVNSIVY